MSLTSWREKESVLKGKFRLASHDHWTKFESAFGVSNFLNTTAHGASIAVLTTTTNFVDVITASLFFFPLFAVGGVKRDTYFLEKTNTGSI